MKLGEIARALPATLSGDPDLDIRRIVHPADAEGPADLAVALSAEAAAATGGKGGALLIGKNAAPPKDGRSVLVYGGNERVALAILTALLDPGPAHAAGIHPTAVVDPAARLGAGVAVGPRSVVGADTRIGAGTTVLANVTIGAGVSIGAGCLLHPGVVIGDRVAIGDRVVINPNAVIGSDGFSFIPVRLPDGTRGPADKPVRIHSLGTVVIGDDVEIGAGTTIDRATLRATRVGRGTKIDNLVQVGHNTVIGEGCLICGQAGISGSAEIGDRVILSGATGIADHVRVGSDSIVMAMALVTRNVAPETMVMGMPAVPLPTFTERQMGLARLKGLRATVKELRERLEALEKGAEGG